MMVARGTAQIVQREVLDSACASEGLHAAGPTIERLLGLAFEGETIRKAHQTIPALSVEAFESAQDAIESVEADEMLIIDAPAHANRGTLALVVQPSAGTIDDLPPAILLFQELREAGVPKERLVVALCRILSAAEEHQARAYVEKAGYVALPGYIPERNAYRDAHNRGQAITEKKTLDAHVDALMEGLYTRIAQLKSGNRKAHSKGVSWLAMTMLERRWAAGSERQKRSVSRRVPRKPRARLTVQSA